MNSSRLDFAKEAPRGLLQLFARYFRITRFYLGGKMIVLFMLNLLSISVESVGLLLFIPFFKALQLGAQSNETLPPRLVGLLADSGIVINVSSALALLVIAFLVKGLLVFAIEAYRRAITSQVLFKIRDGLIAASSELDYRYALQRRSGYFGNLVVAEADLAMHVINSYCRCLSSIATAVVFVAVALLIYPQLCLVIVVAGILNLLMLRTLSTLTRRYSLQLSDYNGRMNAHLVELLQSLKYLKATGQSPVLHSIMGSTNRTMSQLRLRQNIANSIYDAVHEPILVVCVSAVIYYYVVFAQQNIAMILVPVLFFYRCMIEAKFVQMNWQAVCDHSGALEAIYESAHELVRHCESTGPKAIAGFQRCLEFRDVSFAYDDAPVLSKVSFSIPKNSSVAFVGISGEGKTTIADLICGILRPSSGVICLDGLDIATLDPLHYRPTIGYVVQDTVMFSDSIANNISMQLGTEPNSEILSRIKRAAALSNADEFISKLPQAYSTAVGERGLRLSGGQRQRIAIARELFRNPSILILDESTSALDSQSEQCIQRSVERLLGKTTLIIISHRLSTVAHVDQIYVLDQGRIVERGTFSELVNVSGAHFRRLFELQNEGADSNIQSSRRVVG